MALTSGYAPPSLVRDTNRAKVPHPRPGTSADLLLYCDPTGLTETEISPVRLIGALRPPIPGLPVDGVSL